MAGINMNPSFGSRMLSQLPGMTNALAQNFGDPRMRGMARNAGAAFDVMNKRKLQRTDMSKGGGSAPSGGLPMNTRGLFGGGMPQAPSPGPVLPPSFMPPQIGVTPGDPSANLPPGAMSFGGGGGGIGGGYAMDNMTPPAYTPPNPNPQGGLWNRFSSFLGQR